MFRTRLLKPLRHCAIAALIALLASPGADAQVPGTPVLQNAFGNSGLTLAANFGGGGGQSFFGAAGAMGMWSGKLQISAAAGAQRGNDATRGAYGGRLASSLWTSGGGGLGVGVFAGVGGATRTRTADTLTNPATLIVPAGVSVGYRRAMGATRGISVYASPLYRWTRLESDSVETSGTVGISLGLDFSFSPSFGGTIGTELGKAKGASGAGSTFGAAISYAPGRR